MFSAPASGTEGANAKEFPATFDGVRWNGRDRATTHLLFGIKLRMAEDYDDTGSVLMVTEKCTGGELFDAIVENARPDI